MFIEALKSILIGIVQGITEWLPVSSTGHMILVERFCSFRDTYMSDDFYKNLFLIVIQLGSILAVAVLYFHKLNPFSAKKKQAGEEGYVDLMEQGGSRSSADRRSRLAFGRLA